MALELLPSTLGIDDPFASIDPGATTHPINTKKELREMATRKLAAGAMHLPNTDRPRLSSYASGGEFTPLAQVEGRELLIQSIEMISTQYGDAYKVGALDEITGDVHVLCLGQVAIRQAIENLLGEAEQNGVAVQFPIPVKFVKGVTAKGNPIWLFE